VENDIFDTPVQTIQPQPASVPPNQATFGSVAQVDLMSNTQKMGKDEQILLRVYNNGDSD